MEEVQKEEASEDGIARNEKWSVPGSCGVISDLLKVARIKRARSPNCVAISVNSKNYTDIFGLGLEKL